MAKRRSSIRSCPPVLLSKSRYVRGCQCEKALYLDTYRRSLARVDEATRMRFAAGYDFERRFKARFPDAIDLDRVLQRDLSRYVDTTARVLFQDGAVILFEAGFWFDGVMVLTDVLRRKANGDVYIMEVKNSTAIGAGIRADVAVQYYVVSHCLPGLQRFEVVLNDGRDGIVYVDVTEEARSQTEEVAARVARFKEVLRSTEPHIEPGPHCSEPYECPYRNYCEGRMTAQRELPFG